MKNAGFKLIMGAGLLILGFPHISYGAYNPNEGRWINRDPIEEDGGLNLSSYVMNTPMNAVDPLGLTKIDFAFDAFINGDKRGLWHPEPSVLYTSYEFEADNRDFGWFNFSRTAPDARLASIGTVETSEIGHGSSGGVEGVSINGFSHQRDAGTTGPIRTKRDPVNGATPTITVSKCKTKIHFSPSAKYPFVRAFYTLYTNPSPAIVYDVDFTFEVKDNGVEVTIQGKHCLFPDYEDYVYKGPMGLHYTYTSPFSGPGYNDLGSAVWPFYQHFRLDWVDTPKDCQCPLLKLDMSSPQPTDTLGF